MEILSTQIETQLGDNILLNLLFLILVIITLISLVFFIISFSLGEGKIVLAVLVVFITGAFGTNKVYDIASEEYTIYKVTVHDFNEVHENYEIIDQEDDIYTIVEKDSKLR